MLLIKITLLCQGLWVHLEYVAHWEGKLPHAGKTGSNIYVSNAFYDVT